MMLKQTKIRSVHLRSALRGRVYKRSFKAGMNVVRMNTAHASREGFEKFDNQCT